MSTIAEKIAEPLDAATPQMSEKEMKRRKPAGKKVYKPRVPTKIKWALGDCMERTQAAQGRMRNILGWLEQQRAYYAGDDRRRAILGDLSQEIAQLALDVTEMDRILDKAIRESSVAQPKKKDGSAEKEDGSAEKEVVIEGSYKRRTKINAVVGA